MMVVWDLERAGSSKETGDSEQLWELGPCLPRLCWPRLLVAFADCEFRVFRRHAVLGFPALEVIVKPQIPDRPASLEPTFTLPGRPELR